MKRFVPAIILLLLLSTSFFLFTAFGEADPHSRVPSATPTPSPDPAADKIERPTSDPFTGDLSRFDREGRAEKLQVGRVMDLLGIGEGSSVADIGAGSGWFTLIASERVGEKGKVYAVDISEDAIEFISGKLEAEEITNVETVLSEFDDPLLPENSVNAVLILNTYHEIAEPVVFLKNLRKALKKGALVGIIERTGDGGNHGVDMDIVEAEAGRAGFKLRESHDFVKGDKMDYFAILEMDVEN